MLAIMWTIFKQSSKCPSDFIKSSYVLSWLLQSPKSLHYRDKSLAEELHSQHLQDLSRR